MSTTEGILVRLRTAMVVLAMGAALVSAGCSSNSGGSAEPVKSSTAPASSAAATSAANTAWNPCDIPDADIAAVGLNPARKQVGAAGTKFPGWDICSWLGSNWYGLHVYSTNAHTYDEVVHNTTLFHDPQTVTVAGRPATQLRDNDNPDGCTIVFNLPKGPVQFNVTPKLGEKPTTDPCAEVTRIAGVLSKDLPAGS